MDLDIYSRVGKAVAYDEVVPFSVDKGQLYVSDGSVDFDGTLSIQFMKASNIVCIPSANSAIYLHHCL